MAKIPFSNAEEFRFFYEETEAQVPKEQIPEDENSYFESYISRMKDVELKDEDEDKPPVREAHRRKQKNCGIHGAAYKRRKTWTQKAHLRRMVRNGYGSKKLENDSSYKVIKNGRVIKPRSSQSDRMKRRVAKAIKMKIISID